MASISRNSLYLLSGSVVQKALAFIYFIFLARFLGPDSVGKYTFAISFAAIFSIFMELGLNQFLIREAARDEERAKRYFYNIISIKLICSAVIYLILILVTKISPYPEVTRQLVYLAGLVMVLDNLSNTNYAVLRGSQTLKYEGISLGLYQVIVLGVGLFVLIARLPLPYLIIPLILASGFNFGLGAFFLKKKRSLSLHGQLDRPMVKEILKATMPFFWTGLFGTVFSYIDVVLLARISGDASAGFYSAASKIQGGLRMFPIALSSALYPAACFYFVNNKDELKRILEELVFYLILFTLPLTVGLWVLSDQVILILYGQKFSQAIPSLRLISWGLVFVFLDYVFFSILNATGQEKRNVFNRAIAMITIVVLNLIFIPHLRQVGSSLAFVLSFLISAVLGGWYTHRIVKINFKNIFLRFGQILLISLVMGVIMLALKQFFHWTIVALIGLLVYLFGIWFMGLVKKHDFDYLKSIIKLLRNNQ